LFLYGGTIVAARRWPALTFPERTGHSVFRKIHRLLGSGQKAASTDPARCRGTAVSPELNHRAGNELFIVQNMKSRRSTDGLPHHASSKSAQHAAARPSKSELPKCARHLDIADALLAADAIAL